MDDLTQLPERAARKLAELQTLADEAFTLMEATRRRIQGLEAVLHQTSDTKVYANTEAEISRQRAVQGNHQRKHRELVDLITRIRTWLNSVSPRVNLVPTKKPKLDGTSLDALQKRLAETRSSIAAAKDEMGSVRKAPPPKAELIAQADRYVADLVKRGAPAVRIGGSGLEVSFSGSFEITSGRIASIAAWLNPEALRRNLIDAINAHPNAKEGLSASARTARLDELADKLDSLERLEEAILEAAQAHGQTIARRPDADPKAILGVSVRGLARAA